MKQKIKRIALGICMAVCLLSLSACSKADSEASKVNSSVQERLESEAMASLDVYVSVPEDQYEVLREQLGANEAVATVIDALSDWQNVKDDLGKLVSVDENVIVETIDGGYSATVKTVFENRPMEYGITMDRGLTKVTSVSFVPEYTIGENMEQAFLNMVMGMGTVFVVLIFISLIISCFKYINQFETKMKNKGKTAGQDAEREIFIPRPDPKPAEENLADDLELVAVITAAIAASEGTSPSGLVVRSIRRAPAGKWKKA